ncbi:kelch repeat-containing protein [Sorangium sp. So ce1182]|uniref:kelch repeat-containing protein n=1 Tax=Sorangium sp. So ce1182 TaxID=3133334 RepID=UPI003F60DC85
MTVAVTVVVLTLVWWLGVLGCTPANDGADGAAELVKRWFPAQAAEVLGSGVQGGPEVTERGFALGLLPRPAESWQTLRAELPLDGSGWIRLWCADGFGVRVREVGTRGPGAVVDGAVRYGRPGGASFWRTAAEGVEEWLVVEPGAVPAGEPAAVWEVDGAALRQRGDAVEVVDAGGVARLRVTAPRAFAAGGRTIAARLEARRTAIALFVEGSGKMTLLDPLWLPAGAMAVARSRGHTATPLADGRILVVGGEGLDTMTSAELYDPVTDSWAATGPMSNAPYHHTATLLRDGRVLVAGGSGDGGGYLDSAELYDPAADRWTAAAPMSNVRYHHTATLLNDGRVLIAGGSGDGGSYLDSAELYDPVTDRWTVAASMADGRYYHTATLLNDGRALVIGGAGEGGRSFNAVELYDPVTDSWMVAAPMSDGRYYHTATLLDDGQVFVAGGYGDVILGLASAERYDPISNNWMEAAPMIDARYHHTATLLGDGRILVAGGGEFSEPLASAELFDATTNTWSSVPSLNVPRSSHAAARLQGERLLVIGGSAVAAGSMRAEVYLPLEMSPWSPTAPMSDVRRLHTATLLNDGRVLIAAGQGAGYAKAELYDPLTDHWIATGAMNLERECHTATLLGDGRVLVAGGSRYTGDSGIGRVAELYDPIARAWVVAAPMSGERSCHTATLLGDGRVLVTGGFQVSDVVNSAELYDPLTGDWSAAASMSNARVQHTATLLDDGRVLVTGGFGDKGASAELYDPTADSWTAVAPMRYDRDRHTATLLNDGRILVAGGHGLASAELYDPSTGDWTEASPMGDMREDFSAVLLGDGRVLVAGGVSYNVTLAVAELYDPATDRWARAETMYTPRFDHSATLLDNGKVLVAGGLSNSRIVADAELYSSVLLGSACAATDDCGRGFCVEGLCCDSPCAGGCIACSALKKGSGPDGRCGPVQAGTDPDGDCAAETVPTCGNTGVCDGRGACQLRTLGTPCGAPSCSGTDLHRPVCDGLGICQPGPPASCGNYRCTDGACLPNCAFEAHCVHTAYCEGGACLSKRLPGAGCALSRECLSGACLAGLCALDADRDAVADGDDNCPLEPDTTQADTDGDSDGDACDEDDDDDGRNDAEDNCPTLDNPEQADMDGDGEGDACDCGDPRSPEGARCNDGDHCTQEDVCRSGVCTGARPFACPQPAPAACRIATCDPATGACVESHAIDGTPCPGGQCIAGGCLVQASASSTTVASGGAGGAGTAGSGSDAMGSSTAGVGGGAAGAPPTAGVQDGVPIRLQGNGCALVAQSTAERDGELAAIFAGLALAARRRRPRARAVRCRDARSAHGVT